MNIQGVTPSVFAAVQNPVAKASSSSSSGSSSTGGTGTSAGSLQTTFLNLLVTEMQNQDPTSPVDPTTMVSQMVSLNQLDQLIAINQTLTGLTTSGSGSGSTTPTGGVQQPGGSSGAATAHSSSAHSSSSGSGLLNSVGSLAGSLLQVPSEFTGTGLPKAIMNLYSGLHSSTPTSQSTSTGVR